MEEDAVEDAIIFDDSRLDEKPSVYLMITNSISSGGFFTYMQTTDQDFVVIYTPDEKQNRRINLLCQVALRQRVSDLTPSQY